LKTGVKVRKGKEKEHERQMGGYSGNQRAHQLGNHGQFNARGRLRERTMTEAKKVTYLNWLAGRCETWEPKCSRGRTGPRARGEGCEKIKLL